MRSCLRATGGDATYSPIKRACANAESAKTAIAAAVFALSAFAHVRLIGEYVASPPVALKQDLIRELYAHHIRYGYADFWTAYYVDFMSREHIILTPEDAVKIRTYNWIVEAHHDQAVRISRQPCGQQLTPAFWSCR